MKFLSYDVRAAIQIPTQTKTHPNKHKQSFADADNDRAAIWTQSQTDKYKQSLADVISFLQRLSCHPHISQHKHRLTKTQSVARYIIADSGS